LVSFVIEGEELIFFIDLLI